MVKKLNLKETWLFWMGISLNVVSISILLLLRFSAPDMGAKYYNDLTATEQQVFWIAGILLLIAIVCKAIYWGRLSARGK